MPRNYSGVDEFVMCGGNGSVFLQKTSDTFLPANKLTVDKNKIAWKILTTNHNFRIENPIDLQLEKTRKEPGDVFAAVIQTNGFVFKDLRSDKRPAQSGIFHCRNTILRRKTVVSAGATNLRLRGFLVGRLPQRRRLTFVICNHSEANMRKISDTTLLYNRNILTFSSKDSPEIDL